MLLKEVSLVKKSNGFTLLELLVVVLIIGITITIARDGYLQYQSKVNRVNTQSELMSITQQLQEYKMLNKTYSGLNPIGSSNSKTFPENVTQPYYTISLALANNDQSFTLTATPIAGTKQVADGVICINSEMQKYWLIGARSCILNENSVWYGE